MDIVASATVRGAAGREIKRNFDIFVWGICHVPLHTNFGVVVPIIYSPKASYLPYHEIYWLSYKI